MQIKKYIYILMAFAILLFPKAVFSSDLAYYSSSAKAIYYTSYNDPNYSEPVKICDISSLSLKPILMRDLGENLYALWADENEKAIMLCISKDQGKSWSTPTQIYKSQKKISAITAVMGNFPAVALKDGDGLVILQSGNQGASWDVKNENIPFDTGKDLHISSDQLNLAWSENSNGATKILFSPFTANAWAKPKSIEGASGEAEVLGLYEKNGGIILCWKDIAKNTVNYKYFKNNSWSSTRSVAVNDVGNIRSVLQDGKVKAISLNSELAPLNISSVPITNNLPPNINIADIQTNKTYPAINFKNASDPDGDPINYKMIIKNQTNAYSYTITATTEIISYIIPDNLSDGIYDLQVWAYDPEDSVLSAQAKLYIDTQSPQISNITLKKITPLADEAYVPQAITLNPLIPAKIGLNKYAIEISFSELMTSSYLPVITIKYKDNLIPLSNLHWISDKDLIAEFEITGTTSQGAYSILIEKGTDLASNFVKNDLPYSFFADSQVPAISISYPGAKDFIDQSPVYIKGSLNEPNTILSIKGTMIPIDKNLQFTCPIDLSEMESEITFVATDEAGNVNAFIYNLHYRPKAPMIAFTEPNASLWFRKGSTIYFEASIVDLQNDVQDEAEAELRFGNRILESSLIYDKEKNIASGFITLPKDIIHGKNDFILYLRDAAGNLGQASAVVQIDEMSPHYAVSLSNLLYTNTADMVALPIIDEESGIDKNGCSITVSNATASIEGSLKEDDNTLYFVPQKALPDGAYRFNIKTKDIAGNYSDAITFNLNIDTTLPVINVVSPASYQIDTPSVNISGNITELKLSSLQIKVNNENPKTLSFKDNGFSKTLFLEKASNDISLIAEDAAGNISTRSFTVTTTNPMAAGDLNISSFLPCPNPFDPFKEPINLYYTLSKDASIQFFLYDLTGTLIWKKDITLSDPSGGITGDNQISWNGMTDFGEIIGNGVYLLRVIANDGAGKIAQARTKVIVLR
ncbi:MAG: Ig-like domain-containing protein [bacterium]